MNEIDFAKIAARGGSVENAFEELCCQLASKTRLEGTKFERYRGDGGDGGVECKTINANGAFFKAGPLWWNSVDGFANPEGKTIFRDPSASEGGPAALLADKDELLGRIEKLGFRLVWKLLGEKYVLGDHARDSPRVTYSQTASLNKDGSVSVGDRVFFDDYDKDQGLALDP